MASVRSMSFSESVQASIILQRQEDRKRNQQLQQQQQQQNKTDYAISSSQWEAPRQNKVNVTSRPVTIPFCVQLLLTIVFAGTELANTFSVIYNLLFLQFLGVPTDLMTIGGVAAGCTSIICLPITGWLADRGSNLVRRKMIMLMVSLVAYIIGFSGLAVCSLMKLDPTTSLNKTQNGSSALMDQAFLQSGNPIHTEFTARPNTTNSHELFSAPINTIFSNIEPHRIMHTMSPIAISNDEQATDYVPILGIISFSLVDIGYDTANTLCRSFVLECCPVEIHTRLLIFITALGSIAGLMFSTIGTVNFPDMLGPVFHVDGTAATMLLFSSCLLLIVVLSFVCTMVTGYFVHKYFEQEKLKLSQKQPRLSPSGMRRTKGKFGSKRLWKLNHAMNSKLKRERASSSTKLLDDDALDNRSYSAVLDFSDSDDEDLQNVENIMEENATNQDESKIKNRDRLDSTMNSDAFNQNVKEESPDFLSRKQSIRSEKFQFGDNEESRQFPSRKQSLRSDKLADNDKSISYQYSTFNNATQSETPTDLPLPTAAGNGPETNEDAVPELSEIATVVAAIRQSYSMSLSLFQGALLGSTSSDSAAVSSDGSLPIMGGDSLKRKRASIWKNKRLYVILLSMFFSVGSVLAFMMYSGNTLTLGVYRGVPTALPGTVDRDNYEKGLRRAALGNVIMYLAYALAGIVNGKIVDMFGENAYFIASHVMFIGVSVGFQLTKNEELYFTTAAVSGFFRTCSFTLVYIMVHKLVKEECADNNDQSKPVENIGQVMAAIGFLLPCHYLILSIMTGPLISVTGDVWVPVIIQIVDCGLALVVFFLVFVIKR